MGAQIPRVVLLCEDAKHVLPDGLGLCRCQKVQGHRDDHACLGWVVRAPDGTERRHAWHGWIRESAR